MLDINNSLHDKQVIYIYTLCVCARACVSVCACRYADTGVRTSKRDE